MGVNFKQILRVAKELADIQCQITANQGIMKYDADRISVVTKSPAALWLKGMLERRDLALASMMFLVCTDDDAPTYTHKEKGGRYELLGKGKFKMEKTWVTAIYYRSLDDGQIYGRPEGVFLEKFEEVR